MHSRTIFTFLLIVLSLPLVAQPLTQTIRGVIVDKQSDFPLVGVNIVVTSVDPLIGTSTDIDGSFRLENVPIGRHSLEISYLGYETITLGNILLNSAKEVEVNIELEESITELDVVTVIARDDKKEALNPLATVSTRTFSVEEAGRYSGSFNDPAKMAQNFAGVSGASDDRNDIIIRGNAPTGVLWRIEGIDVPSPNHFATLGNTGGPVSMLNINNLSNSDFMSGAWSADYGNALSGVFDLRLRNGNKHKREYLGQIGFNGFELGAEGPFVKGKRSSYLANFRYSTLEVFDAIGFDLGTGSAIPEYKDLTFKVDMPTSKAGRFTVWGLLGDSHIHFQAQGIDSTNFYNQNSDTEIWSETYITGLSHTYFFNPNTSGKFMLAASSSITSGQIDSISTENLDPVNIFGFDRTQTKLSAQYKLKTKVNAKNTLNAGFIYEYYAIDILDTALVKNLGYVTTSNFNEGSTLLQSFVNWQHKFNDKTTLNAGLHQQYFTLPKSNAIEPRLGVKWAFNPKNTFSFGAGLHSQLQPIVVYFNQEYDSNELPNGDLDFTKAIHFIVAHDFYFADDMRLKTELYYQYLYDVPVDGSSTSFSMLNAGASFILPTNTGLVNEGTGRNYGLELTLEKFFSKGYYFLTTLSLFESNYKGSDGIERATDFSSNFVINALGGKEFSLGTNKSLSFDTKLTYTGGKRYTPILLEASRIAGSEIRDDENANSAQFDPYFRWDFKVSFRLNGEKTTQAWSVDLTNLTNHKNIFQQTFDTVSGNIETVYQRGFFPNVQYRILF